MTDVNTCRIICHSEASSSDVRPIASLSVKEPNLTTRTQLQAEVTGRVRSSVCSTVPTEGREEGPRRRRPHPYRCGRQQARSSFAGFSAVPGVWQPDSGRCHTPGPFAPGGGRAWEYRERSSKAGEIDATRPKVLRPTGSVGHNGRCKRRRASRPVPGGKRAGRLPGPR
jgi:hypothetical protein